MRITFNNDIDRVLHFINICTTFKEDIDVKAGRYIIDGKSILGMCGICSMPNIDATIITDDQERWVAFRNAITDYLYTEEEQ